MTKLDDQRTRLLRKLRLELGPDVLGALEDPEVVEVLLNPDGSPWVEKRGEMTRIGTMTAVNAKHLLGTITASLDTIINREQPLLEGELLLDGSRVAGTLPPIVENPSFAIRKKGSSVFPLDQYVERGAMNAAQREAILSAIRLQANILVAGGTSSGKTTLANAVIHGISTLSPNPSPNQTRLPVSRGGRYTRANPAKNKGPVTEVTEPLPFPVSVIRALPRMLCISLPRLSSTIEMKIICPPKLGFNPSDNEFFPSVIPAPTGSRDASESRKSRKSRSRKPGTFQSRLSKKVTASLKGKDYFESSLEQAIFGSHLETALGDSPCPTSTLPSNPYSTPSPAPTPREDRRGSGNRCGHDPKNPKLPDIPMSRNGPTKNKGPVTEVTRPFGFPVSVGCTAGSATFLAASSNSSDERGTGKILTEHYDVSTKEEYVSVSSSEKESSPKHIQYA